MAKKQFKIGEYAVGGIIEVTIVKNLVTIKALDYYSKESLMGRIFKVGETDTFAIVLEWLHELTSSYYADKCMEYIQKNIKLPEGTNISIW